MSTQELQQRTAVNIQEKANPIWAIAVKEFYERVCAEMAKAMYLNLKS